MSQDWNIANRNRLNDVRIVHFREKTEKTVRLAGTLAVIHSPKLNQYVGAFALVNPTDQGSKKIGTDIAKGRVLKCVTFLEQEHDNYPYQIIGFTSPTMDEVENVISGLKAMIESGITLHDAILTNVNASEAPDQLEQELQQLAHDLLV